MDHSSCIIAHSSGQDARVAEILGSVRRAFSEKGFDGASMQDLAHAAGMSVGNFYRYFPSKTAIVGALIQTDMAEIEEAFAQVMADPSPFDRLKIEILRRLPVHQSMRDGDLWAEITAVARRNSEIGTVAMQMEARLRQALIGVIALQTGLSPERAAQAFSTQAEFILLLFRAAGCFADPDETQRDRMNAMIFDQIGQTLDSIASFARTL